MPLEETISALFKKIHAYSPEIDLKKLQRAYEFAKAAHEGQLRKSGEPYIIHPVRTAQILSELHVDEDMLITAFLHDVPEDTPVTLAEIEKKFGKKIAYLVDGITKLSKVHYRAQMERRQIESLKKLFIHSAEDLRVIIIKLADRLDNMRTLNFISDEKKRERIAGETLEIYVPIANLLGIGELRGQLEDLCFEHLYPAEFTRMKKELEDHMEERKFILEEMVHFTEKEIKKHRLEAEITGRQKTLYSTYKKYKNNPTIAQIDDLIALRVIVPTRQECYEMLGVIHRIFKPKPGGVKDYIAVPKPNGYQTLHTVVFGIDGTTVEFQIRTRAMHLEASYGVAAHYFYKHTDAQEVTAFMQQRSSWVQRILDLQKDHHDPERFMESLKLDVFQDRIFVFSPRGDVIDLPRGACALDYAYAIHPDIGTHAWRAEINGTTVPVTSVLATGDTVNILTKKSCEPEREWLTYVRTGLAIAKIKAHLKAQPVEQKQAIGKKFLQKEFDRIGKNILDELTGKRLKRVMATTQYKTLDDLFLAVGEGEITPEHILDVAITKTAPLSEVSLTIIGTNDTQQFREIVRTLNGLQIPLTRFVMDHPWYLGEDRCRLTIKIKDYKELSQVFEGLEQLEGVQKITRIFAYRRVGFIASSIATGMVWLGHPFLMDLVLSRAEQDTFVSHGILYAGVIMLFGLVWYLKKMARQSFPDLKEVIFYWPLMYALNTIGLLVIIIEVLRYKLQFAEGPLFVMILGIYAFITASYLAHRRNKR